MFFIRTINYKKIYWYAYNCEYYHKNNIKKKIIVTMIKKIKTMTIFKKYKENNYYMN